MKNKTLKIWLRRNGLLCRKYEYRAPKKPKISYTVYPTHEGKQYDRNGNEFYGIVKQD